MTDDRYVGMTYEAASREAVRLIAEAHKTGKWFGLPEKLTQLREIMNARCRKTLDMFAP
jgi:hypothetical protein